MTNAQPTSERNLDGYDNPPIAWQRVQEVLASDITQVPGSGGPDRYTPWLATIDPDGKPHVMPVGMLFLGGNMYFSASRASRKARNVERDPRCTVTVATQPFDLVLEGTAALVTDANELARAAGAFAAGGWEPVVEDGALTAPYSAPSAGRRRGTSTGSRRRRCSPWPRPSLTGRCASTSDRAPPPRPRSPPAARRSGRRG